MQADFLPLDDIARTQRERWPAQAEWVAARSALFARLWKERRPPARLEDLPELPFCDKAMLRTSQANHPPFGDYLAAPADRVVRLHRTSGTSGQAMNLALTRADADLTAEVGGRAQRAAGLGPGDRVVHCLNYQMWMGGFTDHTTLEATGAMVIPFGVGNSAGLIRVIRETGATAISCTPSYPAVLERVIAEEFPGLEPHDLGLRLGLFGGEAGLDDPVFRARLESAWGFSARNANYGVSDVLCNFAGQCEKNTDLHFVAMDALWPELVEPKSGEPVPWRAGERGELVLTHLMKEAQPLVRFRSGDIIEITGTGACACGRTTPRFRVVGRADDMVVVRGINVFPTMLGAVLNGIAGLSGEWRIILAGPGPFDELPVEAELAAGGAVAAEEIATAIKKALGVTARVTLAEPGTLPRTEGKTRRVIRKDAVRKEMP